GVVARITLVVGGIDGLGQAVIALGNGQRVAGDGVVAVAAGKAVAEDLVVAGIRLRVLGVVEGHGSCKEAQRGSITADGVVAAAEQAIAHDGVVAGFSAGIAVAVVPVALGLVVGRRRGEAVLGHGQGLAGDDVLALAALDEIAADIGRGLAEDGQV